MSLEQLFVAIAGMLLAMFAAVVIAPIFADGEQAATPKIIRVDPEPGVKCFVIQGPAASISCFPLEPPGC